MERQNRIVVCGPYGGTGRARGHQILTQLVHFLQPLGFKVSLCSELFPARNSNSPESIRRATYKCLKFAKAYLLVFLSPGTIRGQPGKTDVTGALGWEFGLLYGDRKSGEDVHVAFLFDGTAHRSHLSKLLQGKWEGENLEAVVEPAGDLQALKELAAHLCVALERRICP